MRFEEQRLLIDAPPGTAVGSSVWIEQGGVRYEAGIGSFNLGNWASYDSGLLTATDFAPSGLDLCPTIASTISFEYSRSNTDPSAGAALFVTHAIDEWKVTFAP